MSRGDDASDKEMSWIGDGIKTIPSVRYLNSSSEDGKDGVYSFLGTGPASTGPVKIMIELMPLPAVRF